MIRRRPELDTENPPGCVTLSDYLTHRYPEEMKLSPGPTTLLLWIISNLLTESQLSAKNPFDGKSIREWYKENK